MKARLFLPVVAILCFACGPTYGQNYDWAGFAGSAGQSGSADAAGSAARFNLPLGMATDRSGNLYVADAGNNTIRKITAAGVVTTLAGSAGQSGSADGAGVAARFNSPEGVAVDARGNVYVADRFNHTIRKITAAGVVTTLAGSAGQLGNSDGAGAMARFYYPRAVAVDAARNVYVADESNHTIRKITAAGFVTTLAGSPGQSGSTDGTGNGARFNLPGGVAVDKLGNLYVSDTGNHTVRKINSAGVVTTLAGSPGQVGSDDGQGGAARFLTIYNLVPDNDGVLYVADQGSGTVRKIMTATGDVTTITGCSAAWGLALAPGGRLFVSDLWNYLIRKGVPTSISSVKLLPAIRSARAGATVRLTMIVGNNSTSPQTVDINFVSSDPTAIAPPAPLNGVVVRGKMSPSQPAIVARFVVAATALTTGSSTLTAVLTSASQTDPLASTPTIFTVLP